MPNPIITLKQLELALTIAARQGAKAFAGSTFNTYGQPNNINTHIW